MNAIVQTRAGQMADACRRFGVESLELFGSAARADFNSEKSDVDFIVRFRDPQDPGYADRYLDFAEELERILGRHVDLLTERSVRSKIFIDHIGADRTVVYHAA